MTHREDSPTGAADAALDPALNRAAEAGRLLVASDFDGTLSPIVADHEAAVADGRALDALVALASLARTDVVVISGRARSDLARRLGSIPPEVALIGSHGAELAEGAATAHADVERYAAALADLVRETPGVSLERKPFSLALHYRNAAAAAQERIRAEAIARVAATAAAVKEGKKVVEFLAVEADKGEALTRYRETLGSPNEAGRPVTVFVGDDVTDEAAFERLTPPDVTIKVGPGDTAAAHAVPDQSEVAPLLERLHRLRAAATTGDLANPAPDPDPTGDPASDAARARHGSGS